MDKKARSERAVCTKFITLAVQSAGWDIQRQVREEVTFTKSRGPADQTKNNDSKPFGAAMTKITGRKIDTSYEINLSLYQAVISFGAMGGCSAGQDCLTTISPIWA